MNTYRSTSTESHSNCDHWTECDRPRCESDGAEHVAVPGHERKLWLCRSHAAEAKAAAK